MKSFTFILLFVCFSCNHPNHNDLSKAIQDKLLASNSNDTQALLLKAQTLHSTNIYSAINTLFHVLKITPQNIQALTLLSTYYMEDSLYTRALVTLDKVPLTPNIAHNKALCYYKLNNIAKALSAYSASIALDSQNAQLYYERGLIYKQLLLQIHPDTVLIATKPVKQGFTYNYSANNYVVHDIESKAKKGVHLTYPPQYYSFSSKAIADFTAAHQKDSNNFETLFQLASTYSYLNQTNKSNAILIYLAQHDFIKAEKILVLNSMSW
jgi:tetratricopeptide (TPR) repeat protein